MKNELALKWNLPFQIPLLNRKVKLTSELILDIFLSAKVAVRMCRFLDSWTIIFKYICFVSPFFQSPLHWMFTNYGIVMFCLFDKWSNYAISFRSTWKLIKGRMTLQNFRKNRYSVFKSSESLESHFDFYFWSPSFEPYLWNFIAFERVI